MNLSMTIESNQEGLDRFTSAAEEFGETHGWGPALVYKIHLVLEEMILNVIKYGYTDEEIHSIDVSLDAQDATVTIHIVDDGKPFNPLVDAPPPNTEGEMEERRIGGWGIHIVRSLMDDFSYVRDNDKNKVKLVANI